MKLIDYHFGLQLMQLGSYFMKRVNSVPQRRPIQEVTQNEGNYPVVCPRFTQLAHFRIKFISRLLYTSCAVFCAGISAGFLHITVHVMK